MTREQIELGLDKHLIPVEDQTLCCVVSVFVVLKKFTPCAREKDREQIFSLLSLN